MSTRKMLTQWKWSSSITLSSKSEKISLKEILSYAISLEIFFFLISISLGKFFASLYMALYKEKAALYVHLAFFPPGGWCVLLSK